MLADLSETRARQGFTPSETATFVFSLKQPLFAHVRQELERDPEALAAELWAVTALLDKLGRALSAGVYLVRMHAPGFTQVRKFVLTR